MLLYHVLETVLTTRSLQICTSLIAKVVGESSYCQLTFKYPVDQLRECIKRTLASCNLAIANKHLNTL
jgi:hypothetical protein